MIPKTIHYCWFGRNPLPKSAKKYIESWKKYLPGYEIKEWNEDNFDVNRNVYTSFCYQHRLWAYLSDYVRLVVVAKEGGLYFDTDVELIKHPGDLLKEDAWLAWEPSNWVATGLGFASKANHQALLEMMRIYESYTLEELNNRWERTHTLAGCPGINTRALLPYGLVQDGTLQRLKIRTSDNNIDNVVILPKDYMCPFDDITGELNKTVNTISIHWYTKSANGKYATLRSRFTRPIHRLLKLLKK